MTSLYNPEIYNNDMSLITNNELAYGIFNLLNILSIIHYLNLLTSASNNDEIFYNNYLFKYVIYKNLRIINNNNLFTDIDLKQIINGNYDYGNYDYGNLDNYKKYISYPNKYFCLIILVLVRKIFIECNVQWYTNIINDTTESFDFSKIKLVFIKLLKTYMFYLLLSTFTLTDVKTLFNEYLLDRFDLSEYSPDINGGFRLGEYQNKIIQEEDINQKSKKIYELKRLKLKQIELDEKLKDNLLLINKMNDYFENEEHEYLLNYNMEPEIIRKIKDENNMENVFNILKDILQLK